MKTDHETGPESDAPYTGELRLFSFGFAPEGWASCDGQALQIKDNQALFALLGTTYGGDGSTSFNLPDLRARVPIHASSTGRPGHAGGEATHALTPAELAQHHHALIGSDVPAGNVPGPSLRLANNQPGDLYGPGSNLTGMHPSVVGVTGGSTPHENRQPFLALNICICLRGEFPKRSMEEAS